MGDMSSDDETPVSGELPRRRHTPTLGDVARHAGVSSAVVSYVINSGPRPVAEKTRARVLASIDALGYHPNAAAQALKRGSSMLIGFAVPNNTNPYFAQLSHLIEVAAEARGYETVFVNLPDDPGHNIAPIRRLLSRRIDGVIVASALSDREVTEIVETTDRLVLLDRSGPFEGTASADIDTVGLDFRAASLELVRHLIDVHGHERVALVIGDDKLTSSDGREAGWADAHSSAGRQLGPIVRTGYSRAGGLAAGRELFSVAHPPTAVFASSDMQAIGVLRAAREAELSIPGDVAIVSFDGTEEVDYAWPPLTTMRQPVDEMAETAVRLLLDGTMTGTFHQHDAQLIIRESCGCAGA